MIKPRAASHEAPCLIPQEGSHEPSPARHSTLGCSRGFFPLQKVFNSMATSLENLQNNFLTKSIFFWYELETDGAERLEE